MSAYKIEKGVPLPHARRWESQQEYPWEDMEAGDSFVVALDGEKYQSLASRLSGSGARSAKRRGLVVRTRREGDGIRVWLLKREDA